jgi:D-3-phosphoglycerate dehydrogenase
MKSAAHSHEVRGKSLGIVGYGKIGVQLSVLAEACGMQVFYYDRVQRLALGNALRLPTLEALLQRCDIISLHVDGRDSNRGLIDAAALGRMKPGAILLNLSRGYVVELPALAAALESGRLRGAALDVYPEEPATRDAPFTCELSAQPNVIMTPHIGGSTEEAQLDIAEYMTTRLAAYVRSGISTGSVNLPELAPDRPAHTSRLVHLHENVPGMLAAINSILAECNLNITAQHLATHAPVGYALTDIDDALPDTALGKLARLNHTLRCHLIPPQAMESRSE